MLLVRLFSFAQVSLGAISKSSERYREALKLQIRSLIVPLSLWRESESKRWFAQVRTLLYDIVIDILILEIFRDPLKFQAQHHYSKGTLS